MSENLLIIFAKTPEIGKVKTRLASDIGEEAAFNVYNELLRITESATKQLKNCDITVYWADKVVNEYWKNVSKQVQKGVDLGERMKNAFADAFKKGYKKVIGIGTDLPDIHSMILQEGFDSLNTNDVVFGPAKDGGYYLIGMNRMIYEPFENKPWSKANLMKLTINQLEKLGINNYLLEELNDIDSLNDLQNSSIKDLIND